MNNNTSNLRPVFLEQGGKLKSALVPVGEPIPDLTGARARTVCDVLLEPYGYLTEGSEGHVEYVDNVLDVLWLNFKGVRLPLMPYEADADLLEALRIFKRTAWQEVFISVSTIDLNDIIGAITT